MKNKLRSGLASDEEHNFGTLAGIPSGPEDFLIAQMSPRNLRSQINISRCYTLHSLTRYTDVASNIVLFMVKIRPLGSNSKPIKIFTLFMKNITTESTESFENKLTNTFKYL